MISKGSGPVKAQQEEPSESCEWLTAGPTPGCSPLTSPSLEDMPYYQLLSCQPSSPAEVSEHDGVQGGGPPGPAGGDTALSLNLDIAVRMWTSVPTPLALAYLLHIRAGRALVLSHRLWGDADREADACWER